ncbi:hypothetical protein MUK42_35429 [Musa troglodytarum]|uniref:Uncharacterized protein n=1 Tax=Musa troglodytarum TaxID=320322 RepID=A0A9E7GQG4_9LILI|nr:hypothetical protein MUK42_35429 [Musa troglodytarum]
MGRSGGAPRRPSQAPSTARSTCTEARTVRESPSRCLWRTTSPPPPSRPPPPPPPPPIPPVITILIIPPSQHQKFSVS